MRPAAEPVHEFEAPRERLSRPRATGLLTLLDAAGPPDALLSSGKAEDGNTFFCPRRDTESISRPFSVCMR